MTTTGARKFLGMSLCLFAVDATAAVSVTGFGTFGYAESDQSYRYLRFIDDTGTLDRDSLLGVQFDAELASRFSASVQIKAAAAVDNDDDWEASVPRALIAYRPNNDWLLRLGRARVPLYLNSQNTDVGVTFTPLRLPVEVYSTAPTTDLNGLFVKRTWALGDNELIVDGYWGKADPYYRYYRRDNLPGQQTAGPSFTRFNIRGGGLVVTLLQDENVFRAGAHFANGTQPNPVPVTFPFVTLVPGTGIGFYGGGGETSTQFPANIYSLAADVGIGMGVRLTTEYVVRDFTDDDDHDASPASQAGYVTFSKRIARWTPYVSYAWLDTESDTNDFYRSVNYNTVPGSFPGANQINAGQRMIADGIPVFDQSSVSIGASFALTPRNRIKADWTRTRVGLASSLVDAPDGGNVTDTDINVFSLSYSFVF